MTLHVAALVDSFTISSMSPVPAVTAGAFVVDQAYQIVTVGSTNYTTIGAASNTVGAYFVATGAGSGTGTAVPINTGDAPLSAVAALLGTGAAGTDGKTVRSGSGAPSAGLGVDGDFYIDTAADTIYGPKDSGSWGSPTSLVGPTGPAVPLSSTAPAALAATAAAGTSDEAARIDHAHQRDSDVIVIPVGDETTALTTGTNKVRFRMPFPATLLAVRDSVNLAPTGSALIVDINEAGTSVLGTKLSIDATETSSTTAASAATITDASLADDAEISIDIDQIGSTVAGAGLKVYLFVQRA
jgi:hypothetical protein